MPALCFGDRSADVLRPRRSPAQGHRGNGAVLPAPGLGPQPKRGDGRHGRREVELSLTRPAPLAAAGAGRHIARLGSAVQIGTRVESQEQLV